MASPRRRSESNGHDQHLTKRIVTHDGGHVKAGVRILWSGLAGVRLRDSAGCETFPDVGCLLVVRITVVVRRAAAGHEFQREVGVELAELFR
jgi:hypothetical protein